MAGLQDFSDDDEENENQGGEQVLSGESSQMGQQSGGSGQASQPDAPSKSGSWSNLQDYVKANEGNDAEMGSALKSNIEGRANDAQNSANQFKSTADSQVDQGSVYDNGLSDQVRNNAQGVAKADFQNAWDAYYKGPESASDVQGFGDVGNQYAQVEQRAKNAQTHDGRKQLLEDQYNRPTYTGGEKTLDSFILGAGAQGQQQLADINQNYSNYGSGWDDLVGQVSGKIGDGKAQTAQTKANVQNAFNDAYGNYENKFADLSTKLAAENAAKPQKYNDLMQRFSHGDLSAWDEIGVGRDLGSSQFVNALDMVGSRNLGDLASDDEMANYNALLEMSGRQGNYGGDQFKKTGLSDSYFKLNRDQITDPIDNPELDKWSWDEDPAASASGGDGGKQYDTTKGLDPLVKAAKGGFKKDMDDRDDLVEAEGRNYVKGKDKNRKKAEKEVKKASKSIKKKLGGF